MSWLGSDDTPFKDIGMTESKMVLLEELAEDSSYWFRSQAFVEAARYRKLYSLSLKQRNWLTEIIVALGIEQEKRAWRL